MFHHDVQTQVTNNWKRNNNEHPIDRIFTGYIHGMKNSQTNIRSNHYKSETNYIIQRQRVIRAFLNKSDESEPSIRKPTTIGTTSKSLSITSMSTPQILYAQLNESSTNNNNRQSTIKKELDSQTPILIRRQRPTIENLSPNHQMSDITDLSENQLSIAIPSNFIFRTKPSRIPLSERPSFKINERISSPRVKPLNYSKTVNETNSKQMIFIPKIITQSASHSTHTWIPKLIEQNSTHNRTLVNTLQAKSNILKRFKIHQRQIQTDRTNQNFKTNYIQDLFISPRALLTNPSNHEYDTNKKIHKTRIIPDEWEDSKSNHDLISDEYESISFDKNSSTSTSNSQVSVSQSDHSSSPNSKAKVQSLSIKPNLSRRRAYNFPLSPVAEYHDDYETGDEI